ncbi:MAG TPA: division/cell wall cluster transcriptional repressor MraZ [Saprospiraceae bacterium]|nr:division/cell wall cluster transcriptional repressor MraZ [Saprospiraceae bacterium]
MFQLTGEYECKMDDKGRIKLPAGLIRQLGGSSLPTFVLNRGLEKCLSLYPKQTWDQTTQQFNSRLNVYDSKHREILRYFYRGATEVTTDSADRILIPKSLTEYAQLGKDCIITCYASRIEIWAKNHYEEWLSKEPEDFSKAMDEVKDVLAGIPFSHGPSST